MSLEAEPPPSMCACELVHERTGILRREGSFVLLEDVLDLLALLLHIGLLGILLAFGL
jgi:hypothetical protein